mgnify:CR=1 FL=1
MLAPVRHLMRRAHAPVYAARLRALTRAIGPHLEPGDRVLDVGCGVGTLGEALLGDPDRPEGLAVEGLERHARGGEPIPVTPYGGGRFPFDDGSFDVVVVADVLHHDHEPGAVLDECRRVSRRLVIVKDHVLRGPLARARVSLIDWAANAPHGVPCLFRYNTLSEWRRVPGAHGLRTVEERASMDLYPPGVNLFFGGKLQYLAVYSVNGSGERGA